MMERLWIFTFSATCLAKLLVVTWAIDPQLLPSVITVNEGQNATFACAPFLTVARPILSTTPPNSDSDRILASDDERFVFVDFADINRTYIWLNTPREDHGRQFFCTIGQTPSEKSTLMVYFGPEYEFSPQTFTVNEGESFEVSLNLSSRPDVGEKYQWTLNGNSISRSDTRDLSADRLALSSVSREDQGTYVVTAANVVSSASVSFELNVLFAPYFNPDTVLYIIDGEGSVIDCSVESNPPADVTLSFEGRDLPLGEDNTFEIESTTSRDVGTYVCTANNTFGMTSRNITVQVGNVPGPVTNVTFRVMGDSLIIAWNAASGRVVQYIITITGAITQTISTDDNTTLSYTLSTSGSELGEISVRVSASNEFGTGISATSAFDIVDSSAVAMPSTLVGALLVMCVLHYLFFI